MTITINKTTDGQPVIRITADDRTPSGSRIAAARGQSQPRIEEAAETTQPVVRELIDTRQGRTPLSRQSSRRGSTVQPCRFRWTIRY